jgi:hypothetical protein
MKTRLISPRGLVFASILAVTLSFDDSHAQEFGYDDDHQLDFIWTALKGGSLSMSENDRMSCLPNYSCVLAWKVEATCRARPSQDVDSDLIADDWERQNFGTITCDPADDPDQDGMSNYAEFVAGTSPNNRAAVLAITDICEVVGGEGAVLSWESVLGRKYQVLYRDSLGDGEWCCLGEEIVGIGGTMLIPDSAVHSNLSKRFYRLRVW